MAACIDSGNASRRTFLGVSALLFAASAALTVLSCVSMSAMGETPMPGGWTLSSAWMPMCGQSRLGALASFLAMWSMMMTAMMLPSLLPMLWRYRAALASSGEARLGRLTLLAGAAYLLVWSTLGIPVHAIGVALAAAEMQLPPLARAVPVASAMVLVGAGALQFTAWKAHHLACCRNAPDQCEVPAADAMAAFRHGLHLGAHCVHCCAGLTAVLLVAGVMDLRVMAAVTSAITLERLAPQGERIARATGTAVIGMGLALLARAAGL